MNIIQEIVSEVGNNLGVEQYDDLIIITAPTIMSRCSLKPCYNMYSLINDKWTNADKNLKIRLSGFSYNYFDDHQTKKSIIDGHFRDFEMVNIPY